MKLLKRLFSVGNVAWQFFKKILLTEILSQPLPLVLLFALLLPIGMILHLAFTSSAIIDTEEVWQHIVSTVLLDYLSTSIQLMLSTGAISLFLGVFAARLTTLYQFPLRRFFSWAVVLPFAIPAYISAYAYTDFLDYSGPLQHAIRMLFSFSSPQDYYFPEVRSFGGATLVLSLSFYPYIYLFAKTAFLEQSYQLSQVGKLYGLTSFQRFQRITFPLARPAIVIGLAIVFMETLSDFVVVEYFSVSTFSLGVYNTWFNLNDINSAARIALVTIVIVMFVMAMERSGRAKEKQFMIDGGSSKVRLQRLKGFRAWISVVFLSLPLLFGFVFPLGFVLTYALPRIGESLNPQLLKILANSLFLATVASFLSVSISFVLVYLNRMASNRSEKKRMMWYLHFALTLGYSLPGTVLAVGILSAVGWLDRSLLLLLEYSFGMTGGLFIGGTTLAVIYAYLVHFALVPFSLLLTSSEKISPHLAEASNLFGYSNLQIFRKVYYPLLHKSAMIAFLIVFIDCIKEVPTTLILRPFDFETVSTHLYAFISDEAIEKAAFPSLVVVLLGMVPLFFVCRQLNRQDKTLLYDEILLNHR